MAEIKYQYAYDETGELVSINDYTKEESKKHTFRCVGCGNTLLPRAIGSTSRRPHFYHKEIVECSNETYVHKLAKKLLKQKFDSSDQFLVSYLVSKDCSKKDCKLRNILCHKEHEQITIDLKKFYDTCSEECGINGFVADLLLTNSNKPETAPILLEVCVTHECEEDKVASGLKIIELKVKKEQDVIAMIDRNVLDELSFGQKNDKVVKFISFKRKLEEQLVSDVERYILNPSICENGYVTRIDCSKADCKMLTDSVYELNMVNTKNYLRPDLWSALGWMSRNRNLRRCNLCKFYYATSSEDSPFCRLSKKYGKPKYPKMTDAENCRSYSSKLYGEESFLEKDGFYIEEVTAEPKEVKDVYRVIIAGSRYFDDRDLFWEKCNYYLGAKKKSHRIILLSGTSYRTAYLINEYAVERSLIVEPHEADWERYGVDAGLRSNEELIDKADALIAFWDGKGSMTRALIQSAKAKGLKVAVVKYDNY